MLTVSATELGTPEAVWLADRDLAAAPALDLAALLDGRDRVVVVAPHPDDEVLAAGGLIRTVARAGRRVLVVAVTDGEASHPGSPWTGERLAARRRAEAATALTRLGVDAAVHHLALPDGRVTDHEATLVGRLTELLDAAVVCVAPWCHDGHPDHDAAGRAARLAATVTMAPLLTYPVWAWHWAPSGRSLPMARARRLQLRTDDRRAKAVAIEAFTSQIRPLEGDPAGRVILPPAVLARFERADETFFVDGGAP